MEHPFSKKTSVNHKVLVIYGTCSGNAEIVAQAIRDGLKDNGLQVDCCKSELTNAQVTKEYGLTVLISSTWDVGKLNMNFVKFNEDFKKLDLSGYYAAVVGLGDSHNYDVFCGAADIMEDSVKLTGARQLVDTLRIDGQPFAQLNEYKEWGKKLGKLFLTT